MEPQLRILAALALCGLIAFLFFVWLRWWAAIVRAVREIPAGLSWLAGYGLESVPAIDAPLPTDPPSPPPAATDASPPRPAAACCSTENWSCEITMSPCEPPIPIPPGSLSAHLDLRKRVDELEAIARQQAEGLRRLEKRLDSKLSEPEARREFVRTDERLKRLERVNERKRSRCKV